MRSAAFKIFSFLLTFFISPVFSYAQDFSETFDTEEAKSWTVHQGTCTVKNNQYCIEKGLGYSLTNECTYREFIYEADISLSKKGKAGLLFNVCPVHPADKAMNGYYAAIDAANDSVHLYKVTMNSIERTKEVQEIISIPYPLSLNKSYRMKVQKKGAFIEFSLDQDQLVSIQDKTLAIGSLGMISDNAGATFDNILVTTQPLQTYNWSWVKGAVYIPTNCVNQIQQWEEFDPEIVDRELLYAKTYGLNAIRIYLHYLVYEKNKEKFLSDLETFLTIAYKHNLKTVISFFDDVWDGEPHLGPQLAPVTGQHNKRWAQCPGNKIKDQYPVYKSKLKSYVQDVVKAHLNDPRILFWEPYNEPGFLQKGKYLAATKVLLNDSRIWIKETGTPMPLTSTADPDFIGLNFSDFYSWHSYHRDYQGPEGPSAINTECMNRTDQTLAGIVDNYAKRKTGYMIWELGIGSTNSRFNWISPKNSPEPSMPFQGLIYPDGHPWDTNEVALIRGHLKNLPVFNVVYYSGKFEHEKKWSFTPAIDFDLGDERGTGSPDASIGIHKDNFSIRWTGIVTGERKGDYTFYIESDNIARMWLDDKLILDKTSNLKEEVKTTLTLEKDKEYDLRIEYYHKEGDASMHVYWEGPGFSKERLPGKRKEPELKAITKESMFSTK